MTGARRQAALGPVLVFTTMVAAVISSLGAPLVPSIAEELQVPLGAAQWSLTAALLAAAISAPILGRLGDGPRRRRTLICGLVVVTLGGVIAAMASSLPLFLVGRALQGVGLGLVPLTMAAARDHLPPERRAGLIALLSVCAAAGVGFGYPLSGLIADTAGSPAAFWFGAGVSFVALMCVIAVLPSSVGTTGPGLDINGAVLFATGTIALLLTIAQGEVWGWTSVWGLGLLGAGVALLGSWVFQQLHSAAPLVALRHLRHSAVLTGNACAVVLSVALYMYLSGVTAFVQTPRSSGYGFSTSVFVAGLCLVPFSIASLAASRALPWLSKVVGRRALLPLGSLAVAIAGVFFALFHTSLWQAFIMMAALGLGLGLTYAMIPGLIIGAVPESETGSAMGFYQVLRYVGFSAGSAVTAALLANHTLPGQHLPEESGYTLTMWIAAALCAVAAVLAWALPGREEFSPRYPPAGL